MQGRLIDADEKFAHDLRHLTELSTITKKRDIPSD